MAEYIDREKIQYSKRTLEAWYGCQRDDFDAMVAFKDEIDEIPAADVRPVVRAHWTDHRTIEHDGEWYCSACGKEITIYMGPDRKDRYAFCPNCGADMREES